MMITPIQPIQLLDKLSRTTKATDQVELPFQSLFQDAVNNVRGTDQAVQDEIYRLAAGQSDDLHNIMIAPQKTTTSVQLLVQLRNKALNAYNGVMGVSVQISDFFVASLLHLSGRASVRVNHE